MTKKEQFLSVMRNEKPIKWMGYGFDRFPKSMVSCGNRPYFHLGYSAILRSLC